MSVWPAVAGAWLHDLDPVALGPVRWYGLSYVVGFALAWGLARWVAKAGRLPLRPEQAGDLVLTLAVGVIVGGRLGYVLFYRPELLWTVYEGLPFWGVLAINEGGMASHGGMLGAVGGAWYFAWRHGVHWLGVLDIAAFAAPLGLMFGRAANFINGELIGREAPSWLPWAVKFPQEMYDWPGERVYELYAALPPVSHVFPRMEGWTLPAVIEAIRRGEAEVVAVVEPLLAERHPSQLYAGLLEGLVVFLALLWIWARPRRPGVVMGWFCLTYAAGRIVNEFFRRPDPHLADAEFAVLHITRGQLLSGMMVLVGVGVLWYAQRRGGPAVGGWGEFRMKNSE